MGLINRDIIGLDISDASIEAVVLHYGRKHSKIKAYSRWRLSPDIIENGRILDEAQLKEAIKKLLQTAQPRPITAKQVFLSVPESKVFTEILALPANIRS